jgi:hypothetical protein
LHHLAKETKRRSKAMEWVGGTWVIGIFIAMWVMRQRAGVGTLGRIQILGPGGFGLGWAIYICVAAFIWPLTLVKWLATGRPEPRIVFNDKAAARRAQEESA